MTILWGVIGREDTHMATMPHETTLRGYDDWRLAAPDESPREPTAREIRAEFWHAIVSAIHAADSGVGCDSVDLPWEDRQVGQCGIRVALFADLDALDRVAAALRAGADAADRFLRQREGL